MNKGTCPKIHRNRRSGFSESAQAAEPHIAVSAVKKKVLRKCFSEPSLNYAMSETYLATFWLEIPVPTDAQAKKKKAVEPSPVTHGDAQELQRLVLERSDLS